MFLKVQTPHNVILKNEIEKLVGEGQEGSFGILPRHIDFVTKIIPSILIYSDKEGEGYIAVDEGILVKQKDHIFLSVREAIEHKELGKLREAMEQQILQSDEEGQKLGQEISKLEIGIVKSFYQLKK